MHSGHSVMILNGNIMIAEEGTSCGLYILSTYDMYFDIKTKEKNLPSFSVLC